jgi:hypothetical protein
MMTAKVEKSPVKISFSWALSVVAMLCASGSIADAEELAVKVENHSKSVLCAEEDNVTLSFVSPKVRKFRIEAVHPAYLASLRNDNWNADWTSCKFGPPAIKKTQAGPKTAATKPTVTKQVRPPERITLYESVDRWLVGLKFSNFWRKATTTVRVGSKITEGLHLLQLWRVRPNGGEEVLVLYPQDGYWRARPKGPKGRDLTAFGSSFLIGPVENDGRPLVRLKQVSYDPKLEGFDLAFTSGGSARVMLSEASTTRLALDVTFDGSISGKPFAALRSMYVTAFNNDVSKVAVRGVKTKGWSEAPILDFAGATTPEVWTGRHEISRHNTSSPDMLFKWFRE